MKQGIKFFLILSILVGWIFSGWPPIWQQPRIPSRISEAQALVPNGLIVAWPSTNASIPAGWARVTALDTYFVEGTTADPSASAFGNATHAHTSPNHQHTIDHTHTGSTGNASGATTGSASTTGNTNNHTHTTNVTDNTDLNVAQSATATLGTASNDPPYTKVILIQSNGTTLIPTGAWVMLASDTFTSWTRVGGNTFLKGADASGDGGGTGGTSDAHTHTDSGHTHTESAHTHLVTTNQGATGTVSAASGTTMSTTAHSHDITGGSVTATETSGAGVLANGDGQPPYYKLNIIENTTGNPALLDGTIAMWGGKIASIPANWILCDGSGTCPQLNDKFIKGANADSESGTTGGALTHTHTAGTAHSHPISSHTHTMTVGKTGTLQKRAATGAASVSTAAHTHTFSLSGGGTTATQTITADANAPNDNRPPFKEIVYIKYVAPVILTFTAGPAESTASTTTNPTTEGAGITFYGTATAGTNWKLLICKTSGTSGTDCDGGASDRWCVSASGVASGSQNTCAYTTTSSDQDIKDWYGYACDTTSCASESQGSGDSGSPFVVNNPPPFTVFSDDSAKNPGQTVTFSSTANDLANPGDTIQLYVCKTAAFSGGACTGGEWCHTTTGVASNPGCAYDIPATYPDKSYGAYGYVIDSHGLVASGGAQGSDAVMIVNNIAPTISAADITMYDTDSIGDLELNTGAGETIDFYTIFIVSDANSCQNSTGGNEIASAIIHAYRSSIGQSGCDGVGESTNANYCYVNAHTGTGGQCLQEGVVDSCGGTSDSSVSWKCEFPLQYHADPTDTGSQYPLQNWLVSVKATDDNSSASTLVEDADGLNLTSFLSYDVDNGTSTIAYGGIYVGDTSADKATLIEATGNVGLDVNVKASTATMCSDYPTCSGSTMVVARQHFAATDIAYGSMDTLTTSLQEIELNILKTTTTATPTSGNAHWKIQILSGDSLGAYTGSNVIEGKIGESGEW